MSERKDAILKFLIPAVILLVLASVLIVGNRWLQSNQQFLPIIVFLASPFLGWLAWANYRKGEASFGLMGGTYKRSENPPGFWLVVIFNILLVGFMFVDPLLTGFRW